METATLVTTTTTKTTLTATTTVSTAPENKSGDTKCNTIKRHKKRKSNSNKKRKKISNDIANRTDNDNTCCHPKKDVTSAKQRKEGGCRFMECAISVLYTRSIFIQNLEQINEKVSTEIESSASLESSSTPPVAVGDTVEVEQKDDADNDQTLQGKKKKKKKKKKNKNQNNTSIITTCILPSFPGPSFSPSENQEKSAQLQQQRCKIHILPLLILDLNGILCHRIRCTGDDKPDYSIYQSPCANIASTKIIPRPNLTKFLCFLNRYFTLAVWTSAQKRTANKLVNVLFPTNVKNTLLFVWGQNRCDVSYSSSPPSLSANQKKDDENTNKTAENKKEGNKEDDDCKNITANGNNQNQQSKKQFEKPKPIFNKSLSKVWQTYPLWNETNTILLDDSVEKIPKPFVQNALHPPPMLGLKATTDDNLSVEKIDGKKDDQEDEKKAPTRLSDDEINEEKQQRFFEKLVKCWNNDIQHCSNIESKEEKKIKQKKKLSEVNEVNHDADLEMEKIDGNKTIDGTTINMGETIREDMPYNGQKDVRLFLSQHGTGHMGWRDGCSSGDEADNALGTSRIKEEL